MAPSVHSTVPSFLLLLQCPWPQPELWSRQGGGRAGEGQASAGCTLALGAPGSTPWTGMLHKDEGCHGASLCQWSEITPRPRAVAGALPALPTHSRIPHVAEGPACGARTHWRSERPHNHPGGVSSALVMAEGCPLGILMLQP